MSHRRLLSPAPHRIHHQLRRHRRPQYASILSEAEQRELTPQSRWVQPFSQTDLACASTKEAEASVPECDIARRANWSHLLGIASSGKSKRCSRPSRTHKRGGSRSSRTLGAGCDGRTSPGASFCATSGVCADGEVVWFWRSNAGAKSRGTCPARRRWQPSMVTGKITYKP